ncbi:MAG TPA: hypothetical protein VLI65_07280, partial [Pyrinomonadaceae bacterium]|nr:hypothetical protein [Pyrinomonadaceae bacterium]
KILRVAADGSVSTFVENLDTPSATAFASNGDLIVADTGSHTIKRLARDGNIAVVAGVPNRSGFSDGEASSSLFDGPIGVAIGAGDKIYVADTYNDRIRVIENGSVRTLAGSTRGFVDGADAKFDTPLGLAIWNDKVLVADSGNRRIRVVEPDGNVWTLAGNGDSHLKDGPLASAGFVNPTAIAVDGSQAIFVADGNAIRAIGRRNFPFVETISDDGRGFSDGRSFTSHFNRPSGLAFDPDGDLLIADSDNQVIRMASDTGRGMAISTEQKERLRYTPEEFRGLQPARWPFDPPERTREIAGTLGEVRGVLKGGDDDSVWFHNGLDIAGGYGETARFVRSETVLEPEAIENLGTTRELIRMPTMGYIHIRLGRDKDDHFYQESPFVAEIDTSSGKPTHLRIPRGTHFNAGDPIGTLNSLNHVHLIAGRVGSEMNALDALTLPGISDSITPTIEQVRLLDPDGSERETEAAGKRIMLTGKTRVVVRAYDRVDGNSERRRLGVYKLGYQLMKDGHPLKDTNWSISFERMPPNDAVRYAYAPGSRSGYTPDTIFDYIVTDHVNGYDFGEGFIDPSQLESGQYQLRVFASDFFGNTAARDISFEVSK